MTDLSLSLDGRLVAESSTSRRVSGVILPYDMPGATSAGMVSVRRGAIRLPEHLNRVRLTYGHDTDRPIGVAAELHDTATALTGSFLIARSALGDEYLAELHPDTPIRDGLSVDLTDVTIDGAVVTDALLVAVGAVPIPAYADARAELAAAHHREDRTPPAMPDQLTAAAPAPSDHDQFCPGSTNECICVSLGRARAAERRASIPAETPESALTASAVEPAARPLTGPRVTTAPRSALAEMVGRITAARMEGSTSLRAALADITPTGNGAGNESAGLMTQALGELWAGVGYVSRYSPHVNAGQLTGTKVEGFSWNPPPVVADYLGNKSEVPSNAAKLVYASAAPTRLAGAHDIDRIYQDLGSTAVLASYWARMTESLAVQIDAKALALIQTAAGAPLTTATSALAAIVQGTLAVSAVAAPTYAFVAGDLIEEMALTPASAAPVGPAITLPPIIAAPDLAPGTVIVGARNAARLLTFTPPVRVEAVNIPNGGIDAGLFSYTAGLVENAAAVVAYTVTPPIARAASADKA